MIQQPKIHLTFNYERAIRMFSFVCKSKEKCSFSYNNETKSYSSMDTLLQTNSGD